VAAVPVGAGACLSACLSPRLDGILRVPCWLCGAACPLPLQAAGRRIEHPTETIELLYIWIYASLDTLAGQWRPFLPPLGMYVISIREWLATGVRLVEKTHKPR
jgi:hypothetical protein